MTTHRVEAVVDDVFQVLAHSDLSHELILVTVHSRQLTHMSKYVLHSISQLKRIHIIQPVLDMRIHNQFSQSQNFSTQMERISETRLLSLLSGQCFNGFQVEVVVQMKVVQVFTMNQEI